MQGAIKKARNHAGFFARDDSHNSSLGISSRREWVRKLPVLVEAATAFPSLAIKQPGISLFVKNLSVIGLLYYISLTVRYFILKKYFFFYVVLAS